MTRIVTLLGARPEQQTALGLAIAQWFAERQQRTLLTVPSPATSLQFLIGHWEESIGWQPKFLSERLAIAELVATESVNTAWQELSRLVEPYLPQELVGKVYAGELMILPGMDTLLTLNALRVYYSSGEYDVIVYVGGNSQDTLRLIGLPQGLAWYYRRFQRLLDQLDLNAIANAIGGPIASAMMAANIDTQKVRERFGEAKVWIDRGVKIAADPQHLSVFLLTETTEISIAQTRWLWGSAQQVNIPISEVFCIGQPTPDVRNGFVPLRISPLPENWSHWQGLVSHLPDFNQSVVAPAPYEFDEVRQQVRIFLPGFRKEQVKLSEFSGELTVEAGDQRRHIELPPSFKGKPVRVGKFDAPYLIVSF
ncbi:MAG: ArsA-related P-loop ATPase [Thermosynechococcus sp. Uc]|uniref:Get3/ArsA fold putative tail anchor-mediating ATPase NosAFP n=1 Tax=Thermosynechococcus sp. Uc TaxID=3034853 RepID=UPI00259E1DC9|nr:ArsA-related P-loop ATPase [Thermosynechococcus sp. Uc]MDM7326021.1 ArsA-related P-loop ATPase [Thermosynechococcus sp. Uc]